MTEGGLHSRGLVLVRLGWFALVALSLGLFASGVRAQFAPQFDFGALSQGDPRFLDPQGLGGLARVGLSLDAYRLLYIFLDFAFLLPFSAIAFLIVRRRSNDWMAIAVSAALVMYGASLTNSFQTLLQVTSVPGFWPRFLNALSTASVPILAYLFPDGRFVPRWTRWLAGLWLLWALASLFVPAIDPAAWSPAFEYLFFLAGLGTAIAAQVYRYRYVSTLEQRQQTKWSVFGLGVAVLGYSILPLLSLFFPSLLEPGPPRILYGLSFTLLIFLSQFAVPASLAFSILRYRLWDIDLVINLSIVYLIVTSILLVIFEAGSQLLQGFFRSFVNGDSPLAEFVPALFVGFSLHPVHERVQETVNHRLYRDKVNVQEAFVEFERVARRIISLPELLHLLITRVSDLLHLNYCAVYLRGAAGGFELAEANKLPQGGQVDLPQDQGTLARLESGRAVARPGDRVFPMLVPLTLPSPAGGLAANSTLVAILALGPRTSGQGYSGEDEELLLGLADQVGTAIYVARLVEERRPP